MVDAHAALLPFLCHQDDANPLITLGLELACILVLSHFFHLVLKPFGQPGPIAQMLAGIVLGPSGLSQLRFVRSYLFRDSTADYYQTLAMLSRILFMFLIGLEMDVPCLMRTRRLATGIAFCGILVCCVFGAAVSPFIYHQTESHGGKLPFALVLMTVLANSASPIVIRLAAELKLATSDVGRLAISSSLINDIFCLLVVALMTALAKGSKEIWERIRGGFFSVILLGVVIFLNQHLARWLNQRNHNQKYLKNAEVFCILSLIIAISLCIELMGYNSIITCFFLGLMFPREGKTARTLLHRLTYPVHTFILPIYFGYTGFQADLTHLRSVSNVIIVVIVVLLSIGGKISGTLAACHYFKIPLNDGVVLAFLLNLKGHVDLLLISIATQRNRLNLTTYNLLVVTVVINSIIVGPVVALIVQRERKAIAFRHLGLEWQDIKDELRILACVHGPRHVSTMLKLIEASSGSNDAPVTPYLMHLVELTEKNTANLMYHQQEQEEVSDDEYYGGNDALEINEIVDAFTAETSIMIRQIKVVSRFTSMYEDVCDAAEDARASILILPFHKHQRIDGVMESGKEGIRTTNQKVLRHAPCSVAILVDRGLGGLPQTQGSDGRLHIATLFFGGPDDREALAYSSRIAMSVCLTVIRFLPVARKECHSGIDITLNKDEEVLMAISSHETDTDLDRAFLASFHNRFVTSGQVGYVEKQVRNGAETITALSEMKEMYSLFIVGKGGRGLSPLTTGMSDWEECPELGAVGDLLAASDFGISSSILVIQQHRWAVKEVIDN